MSLTRITPGWTTPPLDCPAAPIPPKTTIEIYLWDWERHEACPRCHKPCQWLSRTLVWPENVIRSGTLLYPVCPCPDTHIREQVAHTLAEIIVKNYENEQLAQSLPAPK